MKTAVLLTNNLGCERHLIYTSRIEKYLKSNGYKIQEGFDSLDLVIYNACGFHNVMKEKVLATIRELEEKKFNLKNFIIMGCLPNTHKEDLQKETKIKLVFLHNEKELDTYLNANVSFEEIVETSLLKPHRLDQTGLRDDMYFIKIAEGCLCHCTYCVINKAKGYIKSFSKDSVLEQFKRAISYGYSKIFLTAEDSFAYGYERDNEENIQDLIESMLKIKNDVVFYFNYIKPLWFDKYSDLIYSLCKKGNIGMLWTPIQHINKDILKSMGRPVNFDSFYEAINRITTDFPNIFVSTDVILGFPGETPEIFQDVIHFFKKDKCFNRVYHFGYGDMKGAKSFCFKNKVDPREIGLRWEKLKMILGDRSPYNQPNSPAYQFGLNYDYIFCSNTYEDLKLKLQ